MTPNSGDAATFVIRIVDETPDRDEPVVRREQQAQEDDDGFDIVTDTPSNALLNRSQPVPVVPSATILNQAPPQHTTQPQQPHDQSVPHQPTTLPNQFPPEKPRAQDDWDFNPLERERKMRMEAKMRAHAEEDAREEIAERRKAKKGEEKGGIDGLIDDIKNITGLNMIFKGGGAAAGAIPKLLTELGPSIAAGQYTEAVTAPGNVLLGTLKDIGGSVPLVGGAISKFVSSFEDLSAATRKLTTAFLDRARQLERYDARIAMATARADISRFRNDVYEANRLGGQYATLTNSQTSIDRSLTDIFIPIKRFMLDELNPVMRRIANNLDAAKDSGVAIEFLLNNFKDIANAMANPITAWGKLKDLAAKFAKALADEQEARKKLKFPIENFLDVLDKTQAKFVDPPNAVNRVDPQPPWGPGFPAHKQAGIPGMGEP